MASGLNRVMEPPRKAVRAAEHTVTEHAVPSAAVCFGVGFGVGLLVALSMPSSQSESHASMLKRYSHQLLDAVHRAAPDWMTGD